MTHPSVQQQKSEKQRDKNYVNTVDKNRWIDRNKRQRHERKSVMSLVLYM